MGSLTITTSHFFIFVEGDFNLLFFPLLFTLFIFLRLFVDEVELRLEQFVLYKQGDCGFETLQLSNFGVWATNLSSY